jgi:hypothetical protein
MISPITVSNDITIAETFNSVNPDPFPEAKAAIVSKDTGGLTGFFPDRVSITPEAQRKSLTEQQINNTETETSPDASSDDFTRVTSSIGRAASSGNLNREEALAIYQKIAALI